MDNNKKLSEGLLRADGIDPANISEAERAVFREMLDSEQKRMKHLSWISVGAMLIFALGMVGLCVSENILDALHIPFVVGGLVIMAAMLTVIIRYMPRHNRRLRESGRKISKLYYLVHGRHRGLILIGRKDGRRYIYWSRIIMVAVVLWLCTFVGGAGVYYLLCQRWIISSSPILHIFYCTVTSLSFLIFILWDGLKTPLDELVEIKAKSKQSKPGMARPDIWRIIMKYKLTKFAAAGVIMIAVILVLNIFPGPGVTSVALADVAKKIEQIQNCVFKKTTTMSSESNGTNSFDSLMYYTQAAVREDLYNDQKIAAQVYVTFSDRILVAVDHTRKVFRKMDLTEEDMEKFSPVSPKNIVNLILSKGKYKELGRKTVDGVLSEGFEFKDKRAILSMDKDKIENVVTHLWVDVKTNLPVRVEVDCVLNNDTKASVVMCDPKWDVELEPDFFEPKIPEGYIRPEQRGLIGINLENWPTLKVVSGMPAEKAGVKDGDVVLKVNGNSVSHVESSGDALNLFSGKAGEKVLLTVKRGEQILTFEIERAPLPE
jgi:outer membrane lipoprotein-sorting protein